METIPQQSEQGTYHWGPFLLNDADMQGSCLALGTTGSGKSLVLRALMQDVLSQVGKGRGIRALVYDAKLDLLPILSAYCTAPIVSLSPFDSRGYCWWISKDVCTNSTTKELTHALVPDAHEQSAFFKNAAREILWGEARSYSLSGLDWTLGDLLRGVRDIDVCERILNRHRQTAYLTKMYLGDPKLRGDILATVNASLSLLEPVAACYDVAFAQGRKLALRSLMKREAIVILGNSEIARATIDNLNRCIFKRWTDLILSQPDYTMNRYWTFIDELSEAGPLPSLISLLKKGRSKGSRVVCASQSLEGLKAPNLYTEASVKDMLSVFNNRMIARLECPYSAQYASDLIGDHEIEQASTSTTTGKDSKSTTINSSRSIQRAILPSEFMSIPICGQENGLTALYKIRSADATWANIPPHELFGGMIYPKAEGVNDIEPREPECEDLREWTDEELQRFAPTEEPIVIPEPAKPKRRSVADIPDFNP